MHHSVHHSFLKPLSTGISEKNEWPLDRRAAHPRCSTPTPGVMLLGRGSSAKNCQGEEGDQNTEHRTPDSRQRTRMKRSSLSLGRLDLSSCYFSQAFEDRHFTKREISSPRCGIFAYLAAIFRRSGPPPDGLAVASSDSTSCDHGLPFITIQCPLSSGGTAFRGNGDAKRASALAAAATNSVASIALVFINEFLTRFGKLYR